MFNSDDDPDFKEWKIASKRGWSFSLGEINDSIAMTNGEKLVIYCDENTGAFERATLRVLTPNERAYYYAMQGVLKDEAKCTENIQRTETDAPTDP